MERSFASLVTEYFFETIRRKELCGSMNEFNSETVLRWASICVSWMNELATRLKRSGDGSSARFPAKKSE